MAGSVRAPFAKRYVPNAFTVFRPRRLRAVRFFHARIARKALSVKINKHLLLSVSFAHVPTPRCTRVRDINTIFLSRRRTIGVRFVNTEPLTPLVASRLIFTHSSRLPILVILTIDSYDHDIIKNRFTLKIIINLLRY